MTEVKIRPLVDKDAPIMAELANNKKVYNNLRDGFPHPYTLKDAESFIEIFKEQKNSFVFAIEYKGNYVGNVGLSPQTDVYRKSAELGYFIGEPYWNKGIATKAVNLICTFGFNNLNIVRIYSGIFETNIASQRVLEKCGFLKEGISRKAVIKNGILMDEIRYAKLNI